MAGLERVVGEMLTVDDRQRTWRVVEALVGAEKPSRGTMGNAMRRRQLEETCP